MLCEPEVNYGWDLDVVVVARQQILDQQRIGSSHQQSKQTVGSLVLLPVLGGEVELRHGQYGLVKATKARTNPPSLFLFPLTLLEVGHDALAELQERVKCRHPSSPVSKDGNVGVVVLADVVGCS
ncbi:expressed unknown protein [Seminavis robusta]|uniref:Uncharacterized protein n=1 Tax=Seminavis robusta TaxID=568900 RepID=A0A9N8HV12_9STRA|nr:expressed unknown protein [Seminavis robusta]|eukprot:Sro1725_g293741.1  (125) ;mRNA; r:3902-4276